MRVRNCQRLRVRKLWRPIGSGQTASTLSSLRRRKLRWLGSLSLLLSLSSGPTVAGATALQFVLDTTSLSGVTATLALDLIGNDGGTGNNTVTISDFYTDGALDLTGSSIVNGVTVTTPSPPGPFPVILADTDLFNEFLQPLALGTTLRFTLNLTERRATGMFSDAFSFFLLNGAATLPLFATDDPTGAGALFQVDIDGTAGGGLSSFNALQANVTWTVTAVPLPSTAWLLGAGVLGGLAARRRTRPTPLSRREKGQG